MLLSFAPYNIFSTPTQNVLSNSLPNTPFDVETEAVSARSASKYPDATPYPNNHPCSCNVTIESMQIKIASIESKMADMIREMNEMKALMETRNAEQSRNQVQPQQNDDASVVLPPASRPTHAASTQPEFTDRSILECKGAAFIQGTIFTHFQLNAALDQCFSIRCPRATNGPRSFKVWPARV